MKQGKIILVEGPDGCGKTTLINAFKAEGKCSWHSVKATWSPELSQRMLAHHWDVLAQALSLAGSGRNVLIDRLWISELVYGFQIRNGIGEYDPSSVIKTLEANNCTLLMCLSPSVDLTYKLHKDDHGWNMAAYRAICNTYALLAEMLGCQVYYFSQDGHNLKKYVLSMEKKWGAI